MLLVRNANEFHIRQPDILGAFRPVALIIIDCIWNRPGWNSSNNGRFCGFWADNGNKPHARSVQEGERHDKLTGNAMMATDRLNLATVSGQKWTARGDKPSGRTDKPTGRWRQATGRTNPATDRCDFPTSRCGLASDRLNPAGGGFSRQISRRSWMTAIAHPGHCVKSSLLFASWLAPE